MGAGGKGWEGDHCPVRKKVLVRNTCWQYFLISHERETKEAITTAQAKKKRIPRNVIKIHRIRQV